MTVYCSLICQRAYLSFHQTGLISASTCSYPMFIANAVACSNQMHRSVCTKRLKEAYTIPPLSLMVMEFFSKLGILTIFLVLKIVAMETTNLKDKFF